jgi:ubiquinone/menaquinone biosynthesis C-methylase UbiE
MSEESLRLRNAYAPLRTIEERMANRGFRRMWTERNDALLALLSHCPAKPLSQCRILDFGCGPGDVTGWLHRQGIAEEQIVGVDIQRDKIARARETYPELNFVEASGEALPFSDGQFDIILALTVFSSILDNALAKRVADELLRVLSKQGGVILWYDMRYPNPLNPNLRAMTRSRIRGLFPDVSAELKSLTLLPPAAERLGALTDTLYKPLASVPALRSHYMGFLRHGRKP